MGKKPVRPPGWRTAATIEIEASEGKMDMKPEKKIQSRDIQGGRL